MTPFTPTPLEWRMLADACSTVSKREKSRAASMAPADAADYLASARTFENLAEGCLRNCLSASSAPVGSTVTTA
jgi:hypothetical protein